jgi:hypothetical protein
MTKAKNKKIKIQKKYKRKLFKILGFETEKKNFRYCKYYLKYVHTVKYFDFLKKDFFVKPIGDRSDH